VKVLCIASHPDDEVLGVGGTLLRHIAEGDEVTVVLMHRCTRDASWAESFRVADQMDVEYIRLPDDLDALVPKLEPEVVYTHHPGDLHAEHREVHERALVACRPYSAPSVRALYTFETPSASDWGVAPFTARRFVDVTAHLERKLDLMRAYVSELRPYPHPRSISALDARAAFWGQQAGYDAAEAFDVVRERW